MTWSVRDTQTKVCSDNQEGKLESKGRTEWVAMGRTERVAISWNGCRARQDHGGLGWTWQGWARELGPARNIGFDSVKGDGGQSMQACSLSFISTLP